MSFLGEFRRRNVPQVAIAYLAGAWLLIQVAETLLPIFGQSEDAARPIVVVLAIGFIPALILAWVFEWTPQGIRREADVSAETSRVSTKGFDRGIIVLLVLAVGYFAVDKFVFGPGPIATQDRSIIVLPFTNMSSDPEQEYFGDGMAEELLNLLSKIDELRVISRSTAWTFKGRDVDVAEIRGKLDVTHVLEGSVRKSGNQVRVTAQLIDARTDSHLWSENYDGPLDDIFQLQDRISARIVSELSLHLLDDLPVAAAVDGRAYELYLQGRYIWEEQKRELYDEALAKQEAALAIEPDFIPAMFELAKVIWTIGGDSAEARSRVRLLVERMAAVAPDSSYTNTWQGWIATNWDNDLQAAASHFERAIADDPITPVSMRRSVSHFLAVIGRGEEGYALARYSAMRDPASTRSAANAALRARHIGRSVEAAEHLEAVFEWQTPTAFMRWNLGAALLVAGEPKRALEQFDLIINDSSLPGDIGRLMALYDLGRTDEFETEFAAYREANAERWESIARVLAWTGRNDAAFEYLEKMIERNGPVSASNIKSDLYSRLSADPRYAAFLEKHGQSEEDLSHIEFDPPYPPAMRAEIERLMASTGITR
jgi:TolB-like protein